MQYSKDATNQSCYKCHWIARDQIDGLRHHILGRWVEKDWRRQGRGSELLILPISWWKRKLRKWWSFCVESVEKRLGLEAICEGITGWKEMLACQRASIFPCLQRASIFPRAGRFGLKREVGLSWLQTRQDWSRTLLSNAICPSRGASPRMRWRRFTCFQMGKITKQDRIKCKILVQ